MAGLGRDKELYPRPCGFSYEMKNGVNVSYQTRSVGASISPQSLEIAPLSNPRLRK